MVATSVKLKEVLENFPDLLSVLYGHKFIGRRKLRSPDLNRPGLLLSGFTNEFPRERIQIIGLTERAYLLHLLRTRGKGAVLIALRRLFSRRIPAVVLTASGKKLPDHLLSMVLETARDYRTPVLSTPIPTPSFMAMMSDRLSYLLAPRRTLHGVMVEIHGVGTLIIGAPGVGKSETALELIRRGHRFVADDVVLVRRYPPNSLLAEPPPGRESLMFFMFIRGVGTVYVPHYFGVSAVRGSYPLHIVVELSEKEEGPVQSMRILDIDLPKYRVKLHPLKATATVIETMALHYKANRLKEIIRLPNFEAILEEHLRRGSP